MSNLTPSVVDLLRELLPGFFAAWVFYGLTSHRKQEPFERIVQALIFTVLVSTARSVVSLILLGIGRLVAIGIWSPDAAQVTSFLLALVIGLVAAAIANNNLMHGLLLRYPIRLPAKWRVSNEPIYLTRRTSHPSEWFSAFVRFQRFVTLHLNDGRRIYGWPEEWPDQPDSGSFVLFRPEWLLPDNSRQPMYNTVRAILPVQQVWMVELMRLPKVDGPPVQVENGVDRSAGSDSVSNHSQETEN